MVVAIRSSGWDFRILGFVEFGEESTWTYPEFGANVAIT